MRLGRPRVARLLISDGDPLAAVDDFHDRLADFCKGLELIAEAVGWYTVSLGLRLVLPEFSGIATRMRTS